MTLYPNRHLCFEKHKISLDPGKHTPHVNSEVEIKITAHIHAIVVPYRSEMAPIVSNIDFMRVKSTCRHWDSIPRPPTSEHVAQADYHNSTTKNTLASITNGIRCCHICLLFQGHISQSNFCLIYPIQISKNMFL